MQYILILGDGNFSFSKSLIHTLDKPGYNDKSHVVATSFDSKIEVLRKYPEAMSNFSSMKRARTSSTVVHGVDATQSLSSVSSVTPIYNYIIFNFPHLGVEDCNRHASMIGHILYRVKEVLADTGVFYLTLADEQPQNWRV